MTSYLPLNMSKAAFITAMTLVNYTFCIVLYITTLHIVQVLQYSLVYTAVYT